MGDDECQGAKRETYQLNTSAFERSAGCRLSLGPIEGPAVKVHHSDDVESVIMDAVDDCKRKALEVELEVVTLDVVPPLGRSQDATKSAFKLSKKKVSKPKLPVLIPYCRSFQLGVCFRMADDVHGAFCEFHQPPDPQDGKKRRPDLSRANGGR